MTFKKFPCLAVFALLLFSSPFVAHAQGGSCHDPWINQAYNKDFHRAPSGAGTSGECNPNLYGGGSWPNNAVLFDLVLHSKDCSDPWIGQIYSALYSRKPAAAECSASNYGGSWSSYNDLTSKIQGYQARARVVSPSASGPAKPSSSPVSSTGSTGGSNIVAQGGGNIVAQGGGNIVAQGGGNIVGSRTTQSVDKPRAPAGKYIVIPGGSLVDANGNTVRSAGTYMLVYANGVYRIGSGAGARTPSPGTLVTP